MVELTALVAKIMSWQKRRKRYMQQHMNPRMRRNPGSMNEFTNKRSLLANAHVKNDYGPMSMVGIYETWHNMLWDGEKFVLVELECLSSNMDKNSSDSFKRFKKSD